jgi:hypothetical protein
MLSDINNFYLIFTLQLIEYFPIDVRKLKRIQTWIPDVDWFISVKLCLALE